MCSRRTLLTKGSQLLSSRVSGCMCVGHQGGQCQGRVRMGQVCRRNATDQWEKSLISILAQPVKGEGAGEPQSSE